MCHQDTSEPDDAGLTVWRIRFPEELFIVLNDLITLANSIKNMLLSRCFKGLRFAASGGESVGEL